jgi:hypothetical protein
MLHWVENRWMEFLRTTVLFLTFALYTCIGAQI